uniref:Uncharacterized protein n=1 Tax=Chlorella vulgaris TaxID=3077 RepID=V9H144_CHLVU|nr:hypothetical protein ChvulCp003 [Chlorella vulgaris]pir/T07191/ hypothetical protein 104 - Chlorella vulgaris chloroplast [Chlorella vulgaris]BAA57838.1 unnamed protein product [Chlorella vulgaris]
MAAAASAESSCSFKFTPSAFSGALVKRGSYGAPIEQLLEQLEHLPVLGLWYFVYFDNLVFFRFCSKLFVLLKIGIPQLVPIFVLPPFDFHHYSQSSFLASPEPQ